MTQPNGLPDNPLYFDEISSHDFCRNDEWSEGTSDSTWTLEPAAGMAIKITSVIIRFSEHVKIHSGGSFLVSFYVTGNSTPVYQIEYANIRDFIKRACDVKVIPINGGGDVTEPVLETSMDFAKPPTLWSSTGNDALNIPKFNRMELTIEDDSPYKQSDGTTAAEMAVSRYECEYYTDPDYEA